MSTYRPIVELTLARLREFYREPAAVFWVYGFPLLLAVGLGIAFRDRPVERIPIDIVADGELGPAPADELRERLATDERLQLSLCSQSVAEERLRTGKTGLVLTPTATAPGWAFRIDPNRPESVLAKSAADTALVRSSVANMAAAPVTESNEIGGRYIDFLLPGLIGANLMGGGLFGVGFVVVDLRVRKLLKRYLATPMVRRDFLLALLFSRLLFTLVEVSILLVFARLVFDVSIRGNVFALGTMLLLAGSAFAGIGLLLASRAKTIETVSGLMNAVMLPMYVTSGVFFPADRFPEAIQPFLNILPLTAANNGLRAVINDGGSFDAIFVPGLTLAAWGIVCFTVGLRIFRWK